LQVPRARVLIADDEPHLRELLRDFLTHEGYEVATVATGADALEAVPTLRPDVVLLDMLMPGLSGTDVLRTLRRAGHTVPMVLTSGAPVSAAEGFFAVLKKPFNLRAMADTVAAAVHHGQTAHG
jgi:two-component system, OmpR family, response regulator